MESILPFVTFAVAAAITPGPNNLMLAASGVAFGWRRTLPHLFGIPLGFACLIVVCGLGVGALVTTVPAASTALKVFGSVYLLYLAWVMRKAFLTMRTGKTAGRPIRFSEAAIFQFANIKAWIMAVSAVSLFVPAAGNAWLGLGAVTVGFVTITIPCAFTWVIVGVVAEKTVINARRRQLFGTVIVLLMLYTVASIWLETI